MGELIKISALDTKKVKEDLSMYPKVTSERQLNSRLSKIYCYDVLKDQGMAVLPFGYAREHHPKQFPIQPTFESPRLFKGSYKDDDQRQAFHEGRDIFRKTNSLTIECRTGFGKTLFSAYVWDHTDSVAVVMVTLDGLIESWKSTFLRFFNIDESEIVVVDTKTKTLAREKAREKILEKLKKNDEELEKARQLEGKARDREIAKIMKKRDKIVVPEDPKPRVFICMIDRVEHMSIPEGSRVTLIVDEAHLWCTQIRLNRLLSMKADYFIACSATLRKKDGTDKLMRNFSGSLAVYRPANVPHTFVEFSTGIKFETPKDSKGEICFNDLLAEVCASKERDLLIIEIIKTVVSFDRKLMVLGSRADHVEKLHRDYLDTVSGAKLSKATELGEPSGERGSKATELGVKSKAELVFRNVKKFKDCDVLFGTFSKLSTGFDYSAALNGDCDGTISVILFVNTIAQETTYEQSKGRGMRGEDPVIIMLKDDNFLLKRHINKNREYRKKTNSKEVSVSAISELKNVFERTEHSERSEPTDQPDDTDELGDE